MFRILFVTWATIAGAQVVAQVKDTIRENTDYRYNSFSEKENHEAESLRPIGQKKQNAFRQSKSQTKDTLREYIDYSRSYYRYYETNKYRQRSNVSHYVSLQIGQLLQNLFNIEFNNPNLKNPFEIAYSINNLKKGYGLGFGWGYEFEQQKEKTPANDEIESGNSATMFRFSLDKKIPLNRIFIAGAGIDFLLSQNKNITKTYLSGLVDEANIKTSGVGLGPRVFLLCKVYPRFYVGTEACWYFQKLKTKTRNQFTGLPANVTESERFTSTFLAPVSLFVTVKFN